MKKTLLLIAVLIGSTAHAAVSSRSVSYAAGGAALEGVLFDAGGTGRRPAVVVFPDWMGNGAFSQKKAAELAQAGFVALAADMYGRGVRPADAGEAAKLSGALKADRSLLRARARGAIEVLRRNSQVDPKRIIAIGYCFGGTVVLELARSGAPVAGVASFHGNLDTTLPAKKGKAPAKMLVMHGWDDPYAPWEQVTAFRSEMQAAGADVQLVAYSGAVHSFTNDALPADNSKGAAYNAAADRRSWEALKDFLAEVAGVKP